jgi:hypothetical protein
MNQDQKVHEPSRATFETWLRSRHITALERNPLGYNYQSDPVQCMWEGWCAAREHGMKEGDIYDAVRARVAEKELEDARGIIKHVEGKFTSIFQELQAVKEDATDHLQEIDNLKGFIKQYSEVWWWCHNNHASLQHGELFSDIETTFSVVLTGEVVPRQDSGGGPCEGQGWASRLLLWTDHSTSSNGASGA